MRTPPAILLMILVTALVSACAGSPTPASAPTQAAIPTEQSAADTAATEETATGDTAATEETATGDTATGDTTTGEAAQSSLPAWMTQPLTDAASGAAFTLADYSGRTVYVEPMATWCTNCRAQLNNVAAARPQITADVVIIAISVGENISSEDLASYAQERGFDWTFAVATQEFMAALVDEFGRAVLTPPSTPHFVIRPDGTFSPLSTGIESPDAVAAFINNGGA